MDPANPADRVISGTGGSVGGGGQRLTDSQTQGDVRQYANGRVRAVIGASTLTTYSLALINLAQADIDQLTQWRNAGTTLLFRDVYGQKAYGLIFATSQYFRPFSAEMTAPPTPMFGTVTDGPQIDVSIVINEVTAPAGS